MKMPKCPKCNEEIDSLINESQMNKRFEFCVERNVEGRQVAQYDECETDESWTNDGIFLCPECNKQLFDSEKDAIEFLKEVE